MEQSYPIIDGNTISIDPRWRDNRCITRSVRSWYSQSLIQDPLTPRRRTHGATSCDCTTSLNILRHDIGSPCMPRRYLRHRRRQREDRITSSRCIIQKLRALPAAGAEGSTITQPLYGTRRASNEPIRQRRSPFGPLTARTARTDRPSSALSMATISSSGVMDAQKRVRCGV